MEYNDKVVNFQIGLWKLRSLHNYKCGSVTSALCEVKAKVSSVCGSLEVMSHSVNGYI